MTKMTHREHAARAMLLGRQYDWRDGTYCKGTDQTKGPGNSDMVDCVTLKRVSPLDTNTRMKFNGIDILTARVKWRVPEWETPWARMDDND